MARTIQSDTSTAQSFLNCSVYDQAREHLLQGHADFYVYKPCGATGDFIGALGYVREALILSGWVNTFTITMIGAPQEYAYFSSLKSSSEATTHCIFRIYHKERNQVDVFAFDVLQETLNKLVDGDSATLEGLVARARPLSCWHGIGLDMVYDIPNGDRIFYVSIY